MEKGSGRGKHPVDAEGRPIPEASWPPGREAPERLERVRRFLNTVNRECGADHLGEPVRAARWLAADGWPVRPTRDELAELRQFRDQLHGVVRAIGDGEVPSWPTAIGAVRLVAMPVGGGLQLVGSGEAAERIIGDLVGIVAEAATAGTLMRLRVCGNEHCQWSFYDHSRNALGQWCSMSACGQRQKMRRYRARQRAAPSC